MQRRGGGQGDRVGAQVQGKKRHVTEMLVKHQRKLRGDFSRLSFLKPLSHIKSERKDDLTSILV